MAMMCICCAMPHTSQYVVVHTLKAEKGYPKKEAKEAEQPPKEEEKVAIKMKALLDGGPGEPAKPKEKSPNKAEQEFLYVHAQMLLIHVGTYDALTMHTSRALRMYAFHM